MKKNRQYIWFYQSYKNISSIHYWYYVSRGFFNVFLGIFSTCVPQKMILLVNMCYPKQHFQIRHDQSYISSIYVFLIAPLDRDVSLVEEKTYVSSGLENLTFILISKINFNASQVLINITRDRLNIFFHFPNV